MYSLFSLGQLKDELRKRKASLKGKKADLVARLEAYDRTFDALEEENVNDEAMVTPPNDTYKDINADTSLPPFTKLHIQAFIERFGKTATNAKQMYESRHLMTARISIAGDDTYIKGQCRASMKKMFYVVDIKLSTSSASIEETHCECAAGSGVDAHCKHVLVMMFGIEQMVSLKCILLHEVSTQRLMTFKTPKPFYNSPMQCHQLPSKRKKESLIYSPVQENAIPKNYSEFVRNILINFGETSAPLKQMFPPANTYAVEWDHSFYDDKTGEHKILESLYLVNVTDEVITKLEKSTRMQADCSQWAMLRKTRLTASFFYEICHAREVTKAHLVEKIMNPKEFHSKATMHGKINEGPALKKFEDMYSVSVEKCGIFISKEHPFLGASPDGIYQEGLIEVKCPYAARYRHINSVTVPYLEILNNELTLKKSHQYYSQIQGQLFCTGRKYCILVIFTISHLQTIHIERDEAFISEMISKLRIFYNSYFKKAIVEKYLYKNYSSFK